jgi:hypothetical protein
MLRAGSKLGPYETQAAIDPGSGVLTPGKSQGRIGSAKGRGAHEHNLRWAETVPQSATRASMHREAGAEFASPCEAHFFFSSSVQSKTTVVGGASCVPGSGTLVTNLLPSDSRSKNAKSRGSLTNRDAGFPN